MSPFRHPIAKIGTFPIWVSCYYPLLGPTWSRRRCWAAIQLSDHPEPSGRVVHEVHGLNSSAPHSQAAEAAIPCLCKQERKCPTPVRRRLSWTHASWKGHSTRVGADVGDESTDSRSVLRQLRTPSVIRSERRTSVVVRWIDELLCGGYNWVSQFEMPCIITRWTGERWVEQMYRLDGTAC